MIQVKFLMLRYATWAKEIREIREIYNLLPLFIQEKISNNLYRRTKNHPLYITSSQCPRHFWKKKENHNYFLVFLGHINLRFAIELRSKLPEF